MPTTVPPFTPITPAIPPIPPTPPQKKFPILLIVTLVVFLISTTALLAYQNFQLRKQIAQPKPSPISSPSPALPSPAAENEVFGIQINTCCSCPTKIDKSLIGTNGWVLYEQGKNYSSLLPDECKRVDCAPCPPLEETSSKVKECYEKTSCKGPMPCMANPASVFCICMGGELEIRENDQGQYGVCLIDGQEYDEWEYFRTMNPEDKKYSQ